MQYQVPVVWTAVHPVEALQDSLSQWQMLWHCLPYVGKGHIRVQFVPKEPGIHS